MAVEVVMPKLGMAMKEGIVSIWNKEIGDTVSKGEPIASVNSEKIEIDLESPAEGTLLKIAVPEGEGVPPGTVICYIGNQGEEIMADTSKPELQKPIEANNTDTNVKIEQHVNQPNLTSNRLKISPVARKIAEAANLDLETIQGTGPGGRITKEDVQEAIKKLQTTKDQPEPIKTQIQQEPERENGLSDSPPAEEVKQVPVNGMRKVIARRMFDSIQNSAQLTMTMKADVTKLLDLQKQSNEAIQNQEQIKLTITDFITRAVVLSLKKHPQMNSAYIDEQIHLYQTVHLGLAVALDKGLVVPVIRNADACSLLELSKNSKSLAKRAKDGQLTNEEMQGSTFTISNLGAYGIEHFTPILNPPETGILGVNSVTDTPVYIGEKLERRTILPLSLTFDHRVVDGAPAALFLQTVKQYLEEPIMMLL
ncbi:dihydrolipoamide acetyltransferase family protein [Mesobacillus maritimus]|uniref:dihydrolipoamide acetyltransferase family protein n=1 Tax=Mesobacillus maritimus TaxID=1643336 RepID=UPI00384E923C